MWLFGVSSTEMPRLLSRFETLLWTQRPCCVKILMGIMVSSGRLTDESSSTF